MRRLLAVLVLLPVLVARAISGIAERPHVYLVVVDGLDASWTTALRMPRLFRLLAEERARASFFPDAAAVMPTRTDPNHVTLLTGTWPETHGITGNAYAPRATDAPRAVKMDRPELIEVETLFTAIETREPARRTAGVFAKAKLARLFDEAPGRQRAPDDLWSPDRAPAAARDPRSGYASDPATMDALLALARDHEPDLAVINMADVDRTAHGEGPDSAARRAAVEGADREIARLVEAIRAAGRWERSVVIVTADHGFDDVGPSARVPDPLVVPSRALEADPDADVRRLRVVGDGGIAHVTDLRAGAATLGGAEATLARAARRLRALPGVIEVVARRPVPGVALLRAVHPDWHLDHERAGDLLLVTTRGRVFCDPCDPLEASLRGNHGGPGEVRVPLVVIGGWAGLRPAPRGPARARLVDVAPTITALLGTPEPRRLDGTEIAATARGRVLPVVRAGYLTARTD
jgi:hypothetical protein